MAFYLYAAGSGGKNVVDYKRKIGYHQLLSQYAERKALLEWVDYLREHPECKCKLFVDSGAYTAHTKGVDIDVDEYIKLINDIMNCNGDYQLFCIDIDDVVYNTDAVMQEILATIDYRATKKYREKISIETSEDSLSESEKSFAILNAILEETPYTEDMENGAQQTLIYPKIDYSKVYKSEHLIPGSIEFINHMLQKREKNYFSVFLFIGASYSSFRV